MDHIPGNDNKQDLIMVASIMDALCKRIRKELTEDEDIVFCSDKARNNNKNVLPIIITKLCERYNETLKVYINPDVCYGKSCVDANFAVSYRHL